MYGLFDHLISDYQKSSVSSVANGLFHFHGHNMKKRTEQEVRNDGSYDSHVTNLMVDQSEDDNVFWHPMSLPNSKDVIYVSCLLVMLIEASMLFSMPNKNTYT